jgi:hypothetical protein
VANLRLHCVQLAGAITRYVVAEDPGSIADRLASASATPAMRRERDRLLAHAVLSFLTLENMRDANRTLEGFNERLGW